MRATANRTIINSDSYQDHRFLFSASSGRDLASEIKSSKAEILTKEETKSSFGDTNEYTDSCFNDVSNNDILSKKKCVDKRLELWSPPQ